MKKINKKTIFLCIFIIPISIILSILKFKILPKKYFYDSLKILNMSLFNIIADKSYNFTAKFFSTINIFHLTSLQQWSLLITIIFSIALFLILIKKNNYNLSQYVFIYISIILLNIYAFNVSKDIIQFIFFLLIFGIIKIKAISNLKKIMLISIILLYEAVNFRIYYGIILMMIWTIYFIYNFVVIKKSYKGKNLKLIIIVLLVFFLEIFIVQFLTSESFNSIMNARYSVNLYREDSPDAVTIIYDVLGQNKNFRIFIGNYLINFIRMSFPIELILKGYRYIPFIIYQIYLTCTVLKSIKNVTSKNILELIVVLSFQMVSVIFEPDFGSYIRHESTLLLFYLELTVLPEKTNEKEKLII